MPNAIPNLFLDVHPSKAKLTFFLDGNCFLIASAVSVYFLTRMLLTVLADGNTKSLCNALYERRRPRFDIAFHAIWAERNPNMRWWFQVSWWNSAIWKSFAASLEHFVCQFSKYTWNLNVKYEFPLQTYNLNTLTCWPHEYGQSCFIDRRTSQSGYFWLC